MTSTPSQLSYSDWYALRDFVLDAMHDKKCSMELLAQGEHPELVSLVQQYLAHGNDELIDQAALLVAALAPGVSVEIATTHPWLVLEKS